MPRPTLLLAVVLSVLAPAAAHGSTTVSDSASSTNWAGYAVTRTSGKFTRVIGEWTVPSVDCTTATDATYSANWIGLGGFNTTSEALEQLGTESDCTASGKAVYSAWFEVVPAAATDATLKVRPGDKMAASVTVTGNRVRMRIKNLTRGTSEQKTIRAKTVDLTSAEWIVEAPSLCGGTTVSDASCFQTALSNFGTTSFANAKATTAGGHVGGIADAAWSPIAITLQPSGSRSRDRFAEVSSAAGGAVPTALSTATSFSVAYADGGTAMTSPVTKASTAATLRHRARR